MTDKKKSTSGEAPILKQDYGTTPEEKSQAARLFDMIGEGIGDDCVEFQEYVAKERHRAREILRKVRKMEEVYDRRYQ